MIKKLHFMGISGSGCSGAACLAKAHGFEVSGCDLNLDTKLLPRRLRQMPLFTKHDEAHLAGVDALILSPAILSYDPTNKEIQKAKEMGVRVLTWQNFVGQYLQKGKFVIAVCGTHGKSTTSGMLGFVLEQVGLDPTVLLGATVIDWGENFRIGKGDYFVIEADEFGNNFLNYKPNIIILLNIDFDHPEFFKSPDQFLGSFKRFVMNSKKNTIVVANASDKGVQKLLLQVEGKLVQAVTFKEPQALKLKLQGRHNLLNATAVELTCELLGLEKRKIKNALSKFTGLVRRMEKVGEKSKMVIFDDYAHHPTEIRATVTALRERYLNEKIAVVFQPHLYTRTKVLFGDFVSVLKSVPADSVFLVDIFGARERTGDVSSRDLVEACASKKVQYIGDLESAYQFLKNKRFDVLVNMGAGDIFKLSDRLLKN